MQCQRVASQPVKPTPKSSETPPITERHREESKCSTSVCVCVWIRAACIKRLIGKCVWACAVVPPWLSVSSAAASQRWPHSGCPERSRWRLRLCWLLAHVIGSDLKETHGTEASNRSDVLNWMLFTARGDVTTSDGWKESLEMWVTIKNALYWFKLS